MKDRGCLKNLVVIAGIDSRSSFSLVKMGCRVEPGMTTLINVGLCDSR